MHLTTHTVSYPTEKVYISEKLKTGSPYWLLKKTPKRYTAVLIIVNWIATKAYIITTEDFKSL